MWELKVAYATVFVEGVGVFLIEAFLADLLVGGSPIADVIGATACSELVEGHLIFRERSCFIWEYVFDLTQFFIQIGA